METARPQVKSSSGGWRDGMFSVLFNGIIFEIQFADSEMLKARKGLDAHKSYAQFRSLFELFGLLGIELEADGAATTAAADSSEDSAATVAALMAEVAALKAEVAALKAGHPPALCCTLC